MMIFKPGIFSFLGEPRTEDSRNLHDFLASGIISIFLVMSRAGKNMQQHVLVHVRVLFHILEIFPGNTVLLADFGFEWIFGSILDGLAIIEPTMAIC